MSLVDPRLRDALRAGSPFALLAQFDIPVLGTSYLWSRNGTLSYNGHDWLGSSIFGRVSGISGTTSLAVAQVTFTLAGIPVIPETENLRTCNPRGGRAQTWLAAVKGRRIIGTPEPLVDAQLDYATVKPGDDNRVSLNIVGNIGLWKIGHSLNLIWSHEQQQVDYPGDTGMSLLPSLATKESNWRQS
jgi:hypothetical protein